MHAIKQHSIVFKEVVFFSLQSSSTKFIQIIHKRKKDYTCMVAKPANVDNKITYLMSQICVGTFLIVATTIFYSHIQFDLVFLKFYVQNNLHHIIELLLSAFDYYSRFSLLMPCAPIAIDGMWNILHHSIGKGYQTYRLLNVMLDMIRV